MAASPRQVAPQDKNVLVASKIHLLLIDLPYAEPPQPPKDDAPQRWLEKALSQMTAAPAANAFVIALLPDVGPGVPPVLGRTTSTGEILRIAEPELDGACPASEASRWLLFEAGAEYRLFWTYDAGVARAVLADLRKHPEEAMAWHGFFPFRFAPSKLFDDKTERHFGLPLDLDTRLGLLLEGIESDVPAGYIAKAMLDDAAFRHGSFVVTRRYMLARRPALDAVSVAELAVGAYLDLRLQGFPNQTMFATAERAAADARAGRRFSPDAKTIGQNQHAEVYLQYARDCAGAGVDRDLFARATRIVLLNEAAWREPAAQIKEKKKIPHPSEDPRSFLYVNSELVLDHFDFYAFGERHPPDRRWRRHVGNVAKLLAHQGEQLKQKLHAFVERFATWESVCRDIGARATGSPDDRDGLHLRYVSMMNALDVQYARTFDPDDPRMQAYLGWMATVLDKGGGSFDFALNEYALLYAAPRRAAKATAAARESFGRLAKTIVKLARKLNTPLVSRKLFDGSVLTVDFESGLVKVQGASGEAVGTFELFTETHDPRGRKVWTSTKKANLRAGAPIPDVIEETQVPKIVGAAGSALGLALSLSSLADDLKRKDNLLVVGRVSQNVVQTLDALPAALSWVKLGPLAHELEFVAKKLCLKGVGAGLEGALNVHEGTMVLLDAGRSSDAFEATTLEVKGLALIGFGTSGAVAAGLGLAGATASLFELSGAAGVFLAAMTGPAFAVAGIAVAAGTLVVLACDLTLYAGGGSAGVMQPLEDALVSAGKDEFGADFVGDGGGDPTRYMHSKTHDTGERFLADLNRALETV